MSHPSVHDLSALGFMLGRWTGTGESDGAPISGTLSVQPILGGTFLQATEQLYTADGQLDHEDRVFYRYSAEDHSLRALHLQAPGWTADRYVDLSPAGDGLTWSGGPTIPQVQIKRSGDTLTVTVWMPEDTEPTTVLNYHRSPDSP
jgi:hypothetical protein